MAAFVKRSWMPSFTCSFNAFTNGETSPVFSALSAPVLAGVSPVPGGFNPLKGAAFPAPFDQPFHLILNVAVGGNLPGSPDDTTTFPQSMIVDYVRVYQRKQDR